MKIEVGVALASPIPEVGVVCSWYFLQTIDKVCISLIKWRHTLNI